MGLFAFHVGGEFIHALIVIALIPVMWRFVTGRRVPQPDRGNVKRKYNSQGKTGTIN